MTAPSAFEQLSLELINRARLDPAGEYGHLIQGGRGITAEIQSAISYFNVDLALFRQQMLAYEPVHPVAWNHKLERAAEGHSQAMESAQLQSHQVPGELSLGDRLRAQDYTYRAYRENVFTYADDATHAHAAFIIDWGFGTGGMQTPAGHRVNILAGNVDEVGISVIPGTGKLGPWVMTQDFATRSDYAPQLLGVVINDRDRDDFYDIGEGLGGITVTAVNGSGQRFVTTSWASGGYQLALAPGSYAVSFTGAGINGQVAHRVVMGTENLKLDAIADEAGPLPPPLPAGYKPGTSASETLAGTTGRDLLYAGSGNDVVQGRSGNDRLSGEDYDARFDPAAAQILRLYLATLDRMPNEAGHLNWTNHLMGGARLADVARGFVNSAEFQQRFDADTPRDFVRLLYNNVLERAPDAAGLANWTEQLTSGAMTRAQVAVGFSESAEFQMRSEPEVLRFSRAGYEAGWGDDVYRLYGAALGRAPDPGGFASWANALSHGESYRNVANKFTLSAEFQETYGSTTDTQFVTLLYDNVLGRAPDAGGLESWLRALESGAQTRASVLQGFAQSAEYQRSSAAAFETWMASAGQADRLEGGTGNDVLFGGLGADTFVFVRVTGDHDRVADLEAWDRMEFAGFGYRTGAEVLSHMTQVDENVVFADQGVTVTFERTALSQIDADQFVF